MGIINNIKNFFSRNDQKGVVEDSKKPVVNLPDNRISSPEHVDAYGTSTINKKILALPEYDFGIVPVIRTLTKINPEIGQALKNAVELTNTGFKIKFDSSVPEDMVDKMRRHVSAASKSWFDGCPSLEAGVNKLISQAYIGGAVSFEPVVNNQRNGLRRVVLVKPETIRFVWSRLDQRYVPYQKQHGTQGNSIDQLVKLNTNTYKYFALNGDTENPHGTPPWLSVMKPLERQEIMDKNIDFIVQQVGIMGFLEATTEKPMQNDGESDSAYEKRLISYLQQFKSRLATGFADGIIGGYKEDHEFEFHSTTKNVTGVDSLYKLNEAKYMSALGTDPSLMGRDSGTSETQITVVFTKMLSQLKNIHLILGPSLEHIITLELRLAGFNFNHLWVEFKRSTLTDELKFQQAMEIKIRNLMNLFNYGIINLDEFAEQMDYDKADQKKPRIELVDPGNSGAKKKQDREKSKDASDRKVRKKNKTQDKNLK